MSSAAIFIILASATLARTAAEGPAILSVRSETNSVGRYEKLELEIDLRASYSNPFDPDEVDLWAEFTAPSGKTWRVWGLLYRTWRGVYLEDRTVECRNGSLTVTIPELKTTEGRASHIGHDIALKITF